MKSVSRIAPARHVQDERKVRGGGGRGEEESERSGEEDTPPKTETRRLSIELMKQRQDGSLPTLMLMLKLAELRATGSEWPGCEFGSAACLFLPQTSSTRSSPSCVRIARLIQKNASSFSLVLQFILCEQITSKMPSKSLTG